MKKHSAAALAWLVATLLLTSCGGGGGGTSNNVSSTALPGELDASFGSGGITRTGMIIGPRAMTILPNGEMEVPGKAWLGSSVEYILKRYKADGSIDNSFGNGGKLTLQPSGQVFDATGLVHQQDGKVVIVGSSFNGTDNDIHVVRFLVDGTPDSGWGDRGQLISTTGTNELAGGVMAQPDG